ncbi:hypothetical protein JJQ59_20525 [Cupriavidus necator]|uniref:Uncharacterized protein n=1 Tax=Cupriavidus necator TaxID=106590 RepID=A0A367P779_CUPNE|nr:hypothetical protein [Cupriavidus necator]QQX87808.1 hypothetical protein JJQ59_20525 [Cupriavidus necator]RCJ03708.1 hypothetical protein DDK22_35925 [Cupriavidus necator]
MKTKLHRLKVLSAVLCVALAACGGGGDDNGGGSGSSGGTGNSGNTSGTGGTGGTGGSTATRTVMFEATPVTGTSAEFLTQLNGQGARGFRFVSGFYFLGNPAGSEQKWA